MGLYLILDECFSYIHGGAWRDPHITASSFQTTMDLLLSSPSNISQKIAGYASIDYRLSPHDAYPQDRSTTPSYELRDAKHPDHIIDVLHALVSLQQKHRFGNRYLLVGHSCGATLAYQVAMPNHWTASIMMPSPEPPLAILGVEGIYDIPALLESFAHIPIYSTFITSAFGSDPEVWRTASPAADQRIERPDLVAMLAHSRDDELVDWKQVDLMQQRLHGEKGLSVKEVLQLKGLHQEVWQQGTELARAIEEAVQVTLERGTTTI